MAEKNKSCKKLVVVDMTFKYENAPRSNHRHPHPHQATGISQTCTTRGDPDTPACVPQRPLQKRPAPTIISSVSSSARHSSTFQPNIEVISSRKGGRHIVLTSCSGLNLTTLREEDLRRLGPAFVRDGVVVPYSRAFTLARGASRIPKRSQTRHIERKIKGRLERWAKTVGGEKKGLRGKG